MAAARSAGAVLPCRSPETSTPVPSRLVSSRMSPGLRAALAQQLVGMGGADHREAVLGLRVADRVAAGQRPAGLADLGRGALEDRRQDVPRQVLGEGRDREREEHPAAHREHVGERVRRGDLAVRPRVVDQRREEIERPDDREVVADAVGRGVVGRSQPGDQLVRGVGRGVGAEPAERVGEEVGPELRGTAAAVGQVGQSERVRRRAPRASSCPDDRSARATIGAGAVGSRWVPWSSKPVARRSARRGGFDSHAFPPQGDDRGAGTFRADARWGILADRHSRRSPSATRSIPKGTSSVDSGDDDDGDWFRSEGVIT